LLLACGTLTFMNTFIRQKRQKESLDRDRIYTKIEVKDMHRNHKTAQHAIAMRQFVFVIGKFIVQVNVKDCSDMFSLRQPRLNKK